MRSRTPLLIGCGLLALALSSCVSGEGAREPAASRSDAEPMTVLADDMTELRDSFNAVADRWRAVALVSPTCSECVLGAEALEREITARFPSERVAALVVWIPMLPSDDEAAAHAASSIFPRGRARHFYDGKQSLGWEYARHTFAGFMQRARRAMSDEDPLAAVFDERAADGGGPQWDLYMLYAPGVEWRAGAAAPLPTHWIRHCGREDGETSAYWRDTPDTPPQRGDLHQAMRRMAEDALRAEPELAIDILSSADCPHARPTCDAVEIAVSALGLRAQVRCVPQDTLAADDPLRSWPSPTVLVDGHELFGRSRPNGSASACRASAVPSHHDVADALRARSLR